MCLWGDGLDPYRRRIAAGEDREAVIADLQTRRDDMAGEMRPDNAAAVRRALDQTDAYIREVRNPTEHMTDAW